MATKLAVGILIGGNGSRLGGVPKGLLRAPNGVPILEQLMRELAIAAPDAQVYLLGAHPAYAHLHLTQLADSPPGIGPLGGLNALLGVNSEEVVLLGCDMPFVNASLLRRLLQAPCVSAIAASSDGEHFEPLFSRFNVKVTLPAVERLITQRRYSLQGVLAAVGAEALVLSPEEAVELRDWDTPEDVAAG